jgi:hypothetical protein
MKKTKKEDYYSFFHTKKIYKYDYNLWNNYIKNFISVTVFKNEYVSDCYIRFIQDLYSPVKDSEDTCKFDYIVLVAKKACVLCRAMQRAMKAKDGFLPSTMPILINTRTMCSYDFLESKKLEMRLKC